MLVGAAYTPLLVRADAPPLTIVKSASPDPVVIGDELTYTIVVTNIGNTALEGVVVKDVVPHNTTLLIANALDGHWLIGTPASGEAGVVEWLAQDALLPGQAVRLLCMVRVEAAEQGVVNATYEAGAEGFDEVVQGEAVTAHLVSPTASLTPRPSPTWPAATATEPPATPVTQTPTSGPAPSFTPASPIVTPPLTATRSRPTPSPTLTQARQETATAAPPSSPTVAAPTTQTQPTGVDLTRILVVSVVLGACVLVIALVGGVTWWITRRQTRA